MNTIKIWPTRGYEHNPKIELETAKLLINGNFIESETQEWQDIINPATQEVIGRVPFATVKEVDAAILLHNMLLLLGVRLQFRHRMRIMLVTRLNPCQHERNCASTNG